MPLFISVLVLFSGLMFARSKTKPRSKMFFSWPSLFGEDPSEPDMLGEKLVEMFEKLGLGLIPKTVYKVDEEFFFWHDITAY